MGRRHSRRLSRRLVGGCCLVWALLSLTGATATSRPPRSASDVSRPDLRVLQLNLCDSGIAACYTGRSVRAAAEVIRAEQPDIVTLNEVCRDDVSALEPALSHTNRGGVVQSAFEAAVDRRTAGAFRCSNGQPYGIGLLVRIRQPYQGYSSLGAVYPIQDITDPEQRVWLCLHAVGKFYACVTHLASTSRSVANAQCGYLLDTALPAVRRQGGQDPVVLGGDFNLRFGGGSDDGRFCLPPGYRRVTDGAIQYIVVSAELAVSSSRSVSLHGTTDHPGLLVDLTVRDHRLPLPAWTKPHQACRLTSRHNASRSPASTAVNSTPRWPSWISSAPALSRRRPASPRSNCAVLSFLAGPRSSG
jgi:endonuclease/exonuclease/phosphatase family metal-dependent hydrolase